jgi:copper(I)-binding protein
VSTLPRPSRATHVRAAIATIAFLGAGAAIAADITLKNAWMRPTRAGFPTAAVYVDIRTDVPLRLVGVRSPIAKSAGIVLVDQNPDGTTTERPAKEADIAGGRETRFAYNGSRIELRDILETLTPGANVPLTLDFVEAPGDARHSIEIGVLVRGVILPPPLEPGKSASEKPPG